VVTLRAGVVGAGFVANAHVNAYAALPDVRIVGVADPVVTKAERLAAPVGAAALAGLDELIDAGIDVVSICTPSPTHAALAIQALDAGLHVLCEKPIARSLADGRRLVTAAQTSSGLLMIGHVSRFEPEHRLAKQLADAGQLGPIQMMSHSMTTAMPGWSEVGWLADTELSGGPLVDLAVHSFDFLAWISGAIPVRVHAVGADTAAGPSTYALVTIRYDSGAIALVETSWAHPVSHGFKLATEIIGTDGRVSWTYDDIVGGMVHFADRPSVALEPLSDRGFRAEVRAFVDAVRSGQPSPVPAYEGLTALRTALAAHESLRTGEMVDMSAARDE
jgi:predicted dehydrogenase